MSHENHNDLIYPWGKLDHSNHRTIPIQLDDETLRDGLQSPSVKMPSIEEKIKILHFMDKLGISIADIGIPNASATIKKDVMRLCQEALKCKMRIKIACAGRTVIQDIEPIVEISQSLGMPIEAQLFIGSSKIRQYTEGWDLDRLKKCTTESIKFATDHNLDVMYVTEDTTRTDPALLKELFFIAIEAGVKRLCLSDTAGYATTNNVINLVNFTKQVICESGKDIKIDWHGHNDRGLGTSNALVAAIDAGVDRIHGTCLGIGERAGNAAIDQLITNLYLLEMYECKNLRLLRDYCEYVSKVCAIPIAYNYPVIGNDAFRTATGVHAAAIIKARQKPESEWLQDYIYSAVPASKFGFEQKIDIGPVSGKSNILYWLNANKIPYTEKLVEKIFQAAKASDHILTATEIFALIGTN